MIYNSQKVDKKKGGEKIETNGYFLYYEVTLF